MELKDVVSATHEYSLLKKQAEAQRFVELDICRQYFKELFPKKKPGMPLPHLSEPKVPAEKQMEILSYLLGGEHVSDEVLMETLGFSNKELRAALTESDPIQTPLPEKMVLMTFDDSTLDHYHIACPILEKFGGKAVLFTTEMPGANGRSGFDDKSKYMTWEQLKELNDRGHEIANHSLHHFFDLIHERDEVIQREIAGIEERCAQYGIPKPITFGYPGGSVNYRLEKLVKEAGYLFGRGTMIEGRTILEGNSYYDPRRDTPLVVPSVRPNSKEQLAKLVNNAIDNQIMLLVFHGVETPDRLSGLTFEEMVGTIYENGGKCITFRELCTYIDPRKAFQYTNSSW